MSSPGCLNQKGKKQSNISSLDVPGNVDGGSDDGLLEVGEMASNIKRMKKCSNKRTKRQRLKNTSSSSVTDTPSMTVLSDNLEETALTGTEGHRLFSWSAKYVCCALCLHTLFNNLIFCLGIPKKYSVKEKKKSDEKSGESDDGSKCSWSGTDSDGDVDSSDNVCINKCLIVSYGLLYEDQYICIIYNHALVFYLNIMYRFISITNIQVTHFICNM